jgi:hypothetical protein
MVIALENAGGGGGDAVSILVLTLLKELPGRSLWGSGSGWLVAAPGRCRWTTSPLFSLSLSLSFSHAHVKKAKGKKMVLLLRE